MRSKHEQEQLDSLRKRIQQDRETGYVPTLRKLDLKRFSTQVLAASRSASESENKKAK